MKPLSATKILAAVLLLSPLLLLAYVNGTRLIRGKSVEPFADNLIMYVLLLIVFAAAAVPVAIYHYKRGPTPPMVLNVGTYALVGAIGSTALMVFVDYVDSYFSPTGVGWIWPTVGAVAGAWFGAAFRIAYHRLVPRALSR
jgi:hypothetical protein